MKQGQKGKSIYNKLVVLSQVLKGHGKTKLLNASDWPSFVETVRPIYEDAELKSLFKAWGTVTSLRRWFISKGYVIATFRPASTKVVLRRLHSPCHPQFVPEPIFMFDLNKCRYRVGPRIPRAAANI
jgi:hypothetical protein